MIVIAAAGTGGHVYPALAVAEELVERGIAPGSILFVGGSRMEREVVPEAGFPFVGFELTRLRRSFSLENLRIPVVLRRTASAMAEEIRSAGGRVVLGMSGYVTVPASMAARRAGVPFYLQEQNASPGLASRFAARRAVATFVGLPGRSARLPRAEVVGNPLRAPIADFDRRSLKAEARRHYGVDGRGPVLGVLGGSLGARVLNQSVDHIARSGAAGSIVHLTGSEAHETFALQARRSGAQWITVPFERRMELFYAAADLVVCRAGAMTVSELAATGTPAILVPLARVGQQWNARALADAGGARIVEEGDVGSLPDQIEELLGNEPGLVAMGNAARTQARPDAARVIADRVLEAANA